MSEIPLLETSVITLFILSGAMLAIAGGFRGAAIVGAGASMGLAFYVAVGFVQLVSPLPPYPALTLLLAVVLPLAILSREMLLKRRRLHKADAGWTVAFLTIAIAGMAAAFPTVHRQVYVTHVDTFQYLNIGVMLSTDTLGEGVNLYQLQKRLLAVGLLHAPANFVNEYFIRLLPPMTSASILSLMAWAFAAKYRITTRASLLVSVAMLLALVSMNRFVMHSFYVNGHLLTGLFLLMIACSGWLLAPRPREETIGLAIMQWTGLTALVVTRPEGAILAAVALAPTVLSNEIPAALRRISLAVLGGATVIWHGYLLILTMNAGGAAPASLIGLLGAGAVMCAATPAVGWRAVERHAASLLISFEASIWLALVVLFIRDPSVLIDSIAALSGNIQKNWGTAPLLITVLCVGALILTRAPDRIFLRVPVTTYLPICLLLGYLRGGAYRISEADSLNRMLISIVPLSILFIAAAAGSEWRWKRRSAAVGIAEAPKI